MATQELDVGIVARKTKREKNCGEGR